MNVERHSTAHAPVQRRLMPPAWRHYAIGAALSLLCAAGLLYLAGLANRNLRDTLQAPQASHAASPVADSNAAAPGTGTGARAEAGASAQAGVGPGSQLQIGHSGAASANASPLQTTAPATTTTATAAAAATGTAPVAPAATAPAAATTPAAANAAAASTPTVAQAPTAAASAGAGAGAASASPPVNASVASLARELRERRLTLPVSGITAAQLASGSFAEGRPGHPHEALDILAPRGTPIVAVEDGRVAKLFWSNAGGHTIYQFDPTNRAAYYYAHLDRYAAGLTEGQTIRRGDIIGFVGSTGNADPKTPHLHFAIFALTPERQWWKGTAIDPYPVLQGPSSTSPPSP